MSQEVLTNQITFGDWWKASRPKTLLASIGPVLVGLGCAINVKSDLDYLIAFLTILATLFMQIGTNLTNDYYDCIRGVDGPNRLGPKRFSSSVIPPKKMKLAFQLCYITAFILGIYLMVVGGFPIILIGLLSLVTAYAYTGGPFPLSHLAMGEIMAFLFFGPIAVWGTFFLQTSQWNTLPLIVGLGPGLIAAALMGVNNLRDRKTDAFSGKVTLAVMSSEKGARFIVLMPLLLSFSIPLYLYSISKNYLFLFPSVIFLLFLKSWVYVYRGKINSELNNVLANIGKYVFLYSVFLALALSLKL